MSDEAAPRYTLRVPVRTLGESPIQGLEAQARVRIRDLDVTLRAAPPLLVTTVEGFPSAASAADFVPQIISALWALVVRWNIAFQANFVPQRVTYASDPAEAGNNLARSLGQESGPPVDGIAGNEDTVIFPSGKRLRLFGVGEARAFVRTPAPLVIPVFTQMLERQDAKQLVDDEKLKTSIELFNATFYETSARARFLTVTMILETLAPMTQKHPAGQTLIREWKAQLQTALRDATDVETRQALESLDRELDFRRETSIRQRVRQLMRTEFEHLPPAERGELERQAVNAYDQRGTLVHTGQLADAVLHACREESTQIVRRILAKRLGIDT